MRVTRLDTGHSLHFQVYFISLEEELGLIYAVSWHMSIQQLHDCTCRGWTSSHYICFH